MDRFGDEMRNGGIEGERGQKKKRRERRRREGVREGQKEG